jgi:hypothetical protein
MLNRLILLILFSCPLKANEYLPIEAIESTYTKIGSALFSVLFWDIYNSTLYSDSGAYVEGDTKQTLIFKIDYLKDITRDDLIERTVEQWQHIGISEKVYNQFLPTLTKIWPDIASGDSLTLLVKNQESFFYFNGDLIGNIKQNAFGPLFLSIWLSEKTSQKSLRIKLLGEHKS